MKNMNFLLAGSILLNLLLILGLVYFVHRLGGIQFMIHRIQSGGLAGIYENRQNLFEHLPMEKGSIIFLGDSITEFGQWEELTGHPRVKNRGIAGDTTWGMLRRLGQIIQSQPTAIFLMIGINDFLFTDQQEILSNYEKIIQQIRQKAPDCQLFLQSVLPVNPNVKKTIFRNEEIVALNMGIKELSKKYQLTYIDLHGEMTDHAGNLKATFTADGIHINGAAYLVWKEKIIQHIPIN